MKRYLAGVENENKGWGAEGSGDDSETGSVTRKKETENGRPVGVSASHRTSGIKMRATIMTEKVLTVTVYMNTCIVLCVVSFVMVFTLRHLYWSFHCFT